MNDGMGNPKNVRSMLLAHQTPPAMASGVRPDAQNAVRSGMERILFTVQPEEVAVSMDRYLSALEPVPSPHLVDGKLSEQAKRGRELFMSERINCVKCHPEPLYTDLQMHDVESRGQYDRRDDFDTPALIECWRTAPFMHDGHYTTMKSLFKEGKHGKMGGDVESLTEQELNDLVEFVLSL
jgi:cytochrome c peroxidase